MRKYYITFFLITIFFSTYAQGNMGVINDAGIEVFEDQSLSDLISLYPNPAKEYLHIRVENVKITKVEIFSLLGDKVKEIKYNSKRIYLGDLLRGIYMVKVFAENQYTVKKLIVK